MNIVNLNASSITSEYRETMKDCPEGSPQSSVIRCQTGGEGCNPSSQCFCDEEECED